MPINCSTYFFEESKRSYSQYPHDYAGHFTPQQYMPDALQNERLWLGQHSPAEQKLYERMVNYWGKRFEEE